MICEANPRGLIITTGVVQHLDALRELKRHTGWRVLTKVTTWLLHRELLLRIPRLTLCWLDRRGHVAGAAELLAWLHDMHPAVWRIAVAYQLDGDAESVLRSSGAQLYLPAHGEIQGLVDDILLPLFHSNQPRAEVAADSPVFPWRQDVDQGAALAAHGQFRPHMHPP